MQIVQYEESITKKFISIYSTDNKIMNTHTESTDRNLTETYLININNFIDYLNVF